MGSEVRRRRHVSQPSSALEGAGDDREWPARRAAEHIELRSVGSGAGARGSAWSGSSRAMPMSTGRRLGQRPAPRRISRYPRRVFRSRPGAGGVIRFANGVTAFIHDKATGRRGIEVVCSEGVFVSDYQTFHLLRPAAATRVEAADSTWSKKKAVPELGRVWALRRGRLADDVGPPGRDQKWLRKSEQGDKWNRCLIEGMIVLSETGARDEQTTPP